MIAGKPSVILRQLEERGVPDRELLARFVRERDQSAFAEIVRVHGPVVFGVCRRVTGHPQDAEDAFQAVFLSLARQATNIRNPEVLGGWLYCVAVRVARKVRRSAVRRRAREVAVSIMPEQPILRTTAIRELDPILDEELAALSSWYRDAIVLCDLQGLSREEAAKVLSVPEGTLSSRLANGRKKLAARLTKRGIALSAAAIPTALSSATAAIVPNELQLRTCSLVAGWMAGGTVPKPLFKLTEGGIAVRKALLIGMFATAVALAGALYAAVPAENPASIDPPKLHSNAGKPELGDRPAPEAKPNDKPVAYAAIPSLEHVLDVGVYGDLTVYWNHLGTQLAVAGKEHVVTNRGDNYERTVVAIIKSETNTHWRMDQCAELSKLIGFSPDGKFVLTELREYQFVSGFHKLDFWSLDGQLKSNRSIKLEPTETQSYAFSADGKSFRTVAIDRDLVTKEIKKAAVLEVSTATGKRIKTLLSVEASTCGLSSDGKRLAVLGVEKSVDVYDIDKGVKLSSYSLPKEEKVQKDANACEAIINKAVLIFSPDGHRLFVHRELGAITYIPGSDNRFGFVGQVPKFQSIVLDADRGKTLPILESAECLEIQPGVQPFTSDGRLLALSGTHFDIVKPEKVREMGMTTTAAVLGSPRKFLSVWDTETGKVVKSWEGSPRVAFSPVRPILAVLEPNGNHFTRIGFWDFSAETGEKK
jgi:RNA polymerase sigma factor (sigma-70 family)